MPVALISTSTSPAFGPSRSSSTISSGCLGAKATAARVFIQVVSLRGFGLALALAHHAAKANMAGRCVDRLGIARGRAVAPAVVLAAQMRAAFEHLARHFRRLALHDRAAAGAAARVRGN